MNTGSGTATKTFNLLSIGQRGVGKTVFLAGSYAELHSNSKQERPQQSAELLHELAEPAADRLPRLWFDCQDSQAQENIEAILSYVARTGEYPPLTMKVTNFDFSLKRHSYSGSQTLCNFCWWDIPGEICDVHNVDFRKMVSVSHGCCVFIDAYALVHDSTYPQALEDIIQQVTAIAHLVYLNGLKYAFSLILTKCDLFESNPLEQQQLEASLQPLISRLEEVKANYQKFYSAIPIVFDLGNPTLRAKGAAAPILWLVWELSKVHNPSLKNNLHQWVNRLLPSKSQPQQDSVKGLTQGLHRTASRGAKVNKTLGFAALAIAALVGVIFLQSQNYRLVFPSQPDNLDPLTRVEPEQIQLRLELAQNYETVGELKKAEALYDQVLAEQKDNLNALVSKALLRYAQGDSKTAQLLFERAEKAAPKELKARVRALAQRTLQSDKEAQ